MIVFVEENQETQLNKILERIKHQLNFKVLKSIEKEEEIKNLPENTFIFLIYKSEEAPLWVLEKSKSLEWFVEDFLYAEADKKINKTIKMRTFDKWEGKMVYFYHVFPIAGTYENESYNCLLLGSEGTLLQDPLSNTYDIYFYEEVEFICQKDKYPLMLCSEMKDISKEIEIYEGDIIELINNEGFNLTGIVKFGKWKPFSLNPYIDDSTPVNFGFYIEILEKNLPPGYPKNLSMFIEKRFFPLTEDLKVRVIGNVYENMELIPKN